MRHFAAVLLATAACLATPLAAQSKGKSAKKDDD